jgi:hypothetical protein
MSQIAKGIILTSCELNQLLNKLGSVCNVMADEQYIKRVEFKDELYTFYAYWNKDEKPDWKCASHKITGII